MIRTYAERMTMAIDTIDSMDTEDIKALAREKVLMDLNKEEQKTKAKEVIEQSNRYRKQPYFVKVYKTAGKELRKNNMLTISEKAFLFDIEVYIDHESNIIVDDEGFSMTQSQIGDLCGWKKSQVSKVLKSLVEKGVIEEVPKGKTKFYRMMYKYYECGKGGKD